MDENLLNPHGGDIYRASRVYGCSKEEILDYSANINPLGVPSGLKQKLIAGIDDLVNYPDPYCNGLRENISQYLGIRSENIVAGNGASEVIFLLFEALKLKSVMIPSPTFCEYAKAAERYGTEVYYHELKEETGYELNMELLIRQMDSMAYKIDAVILCNPNNPTSTLVDRSDLLRLIDYASGKNIYVIVDEAFIELTDGGNSNSVADCIVKYCNLFIIRAFTKLFAIPGLRLGYGIGSPDVINALWEKKLLWSVNTLALCVGEFLTDSGEYLRETTKWLVEEKEWFYSQLKAIKNIKVFEPKTNFVLVKLPDEGLTSGMLKDKLASRGVLIRDAGNFVFLNDRFIRIAVKDRKSNLRFLKVFEQVLQTINA